MDEIACLPNKDTDAHIRQDAWLIAYRDASFITFLYFKKYIVAKIRITIETKHSDTG